MLTLGERLISIREERDITRAELAQALGIPYTTLRNYEKDVREPGCKTLLQLSRILNVSIDYIIDGETPEAALSPLRRELLSITASLSDDALRALIASARQMGGA